MTIEWHRGARIMELSDQDVRELSSLRTVLEVFAAREAARDAAPSDLEAMSGVLTSMAKAMKDQTDHDIIQLDIEFHDKLYQAAHHERLLNAWSSIRSQVTLSLLVKRHTSNAYYRDDVTAEHRELFDAVSSRNPDACERVVREHLSATYGRLIVDFDDSRWPGGQGLPWPRGL